MTPEEKLDAIRALVAPLTHEQVASILAAEVRAVLDAPSSPVPAAPRFVPAQPSTSGAVWAVPTPLALDRDSIIDAYQRTWEEYQNPAGEYPRPLFREALADHILALVRPACIDRDTLRDVLRGWTPVAMHPFLSGMADAIIAAIRPASGVWLSPEEEQAVLRAHDLTLHEHDRGFWYSDVMRALAARIKAERLEREARA